MRGDVAVVGAGVAAHLLDLGDDFVGGGLVAAFAAGAATEVVDDDARAFGGQHERFAAANAAPRAGDDRDLTFEPSGHVRFSCVFVA